MNYGQPGLRAEQRRRCEDRILASARSLFAARGYSGATIRAIAQAAETDPALVIRYFDSKAKLYALSADLGLDPTATADAPDPVTAFLASLQAKLEAEPASLLAGLRSTLEDSCANAPFVEAMRTQQSEAAANLTGDLPQVRAGLLGALTVGVVMARYVLRLDGVSDADPERLLALVGPLVDRLVNPAG